MALPAGKARYTFADCLTWDENELIEIIDGEAFLMATPLRIHQKIRDGLFRQLENFLDGKKCEVCSAPFGCLSRMGTDRKTLTLWLSRISPWYVTRAGWISTAAKERRDLVVEVLSPSSLRHDRLVK